MATKTKVKDEAVSTKTQEPPTPLHAVVNHPVTVKAFGRKYEIKKFTMGHLVRALPYIAPLGYLMRSAKIEEGQPVLDQYAALFVSALHLSGEPAMGLISVATSEPIEWLEEQDPLDGLELLTTIVEKNVDYFFQPDNLGRIKAVRARLQSVIQRHGGATSTI